MGGVLSYSGIVTKARAMEAQLLSREEYEKIALLESVTEFIGFLKGRQGYRELFDGREESSFHRNEIEGLLKYSLYRDYDKLYRFSSQEQRKALELVFWRLEADWLKECLYQIMRPGNQGPTAASVEFLKLHSALELEKLQQATNIREFAAALKGSSYEALFYELAEGGQLSLPAIEERLDIHCFTRIWKAIEKGFQGEDKEALKELYGRQIDLLNILWVYRTKRYYNSSTAKAALIPVHYKLKKEEEKALLACYTLEELWNVLEKTCYRTMKEAASVEQFYRDRMDLVYRESRKQRPYSMSTIYNVLYQKTREIERLTTALECIRYQMDATAAISYILQG